MLRRVLCVLAPITETFRTGQLRSALTGKVVDRSGSPLPWLTYPAIEFLDSLSYEGKKVLEFGSGYSTLWWAQRAESVISFEADANWMQSMSGKMAANSTVLALPTDPDDRYHRCVDLEAHLAAHLGAARFDVIVVDGVDRVGSARASLPYLADGGIVVVDNSDSHMFPDGAMPILEVYREAGMRRVDFYGLGPSILFPQCTSIAFRDGAFAFDGAQDTRWLKPFARKTYGDVDFQSGFTPVAEAPAAGQVTDPGGSRTTPSRSRG
ncbi:MAG: hypothetical protein ACR2LF_02185 [Jatrophihabitantaceae bacterium]